MARIITRRMPWWLTLLAGTVLIMIGLALLVWPFYSASWVLALLFGTTLISAGIGLMSSPRTGVAGRVIGLLGVAAGVLAIVFNEFTASIIVGLFGATIITISVIGLIIGFTLRAGSSPLVWVPAILGILAGLVPLVWPEFALSLIAVMLGFFTLIWGITVLSMAMRQRRDPNVGVRTVQFSSDDDPDITFYPPVRD